MKETIYTIPLTDILSSGAVCPFCWYETRLTTDLLSLYMEGGLMEPDWRGKLLEKGLCQKHLHILYQQERKLGVAITVEAILSYELSRIKKSASGKKPKRSWRSTAIYDQLGELLQQRETGCLACQDLKRNLRQTAANFWHMMTSEPQFQELVFQCRGFCLPHFNLLWQVGMKQCSGKQYLQLMAPLLQWETTLLEQAVVRLNGFIQKFDYRFADQPMEEDKTAVEVGMARLRGVWMGKKDEV